LNPHSYVVATNDPDFEAALKGADMLLPDGVGVVMAGALLGIAFAERITGWDLFSGLHERLNSVGGASVFFLGSSPNVLKRISERMLVEYPNVTVVGLLSPPFSHSFSEEETKEIVRMINGVRPDILWVGMTAPKQEKWLQANRDRLCVKLACSVGAVFDFYAGTRKRSHPIFQRLGLEWLPRLIREPRRLWRRMLVSAPVFVFHVVRARLLK
jgi:N-acetylglucosaminyldiphosphoundecaprenol N-acetyl-beta-D-mannosaminyltransferase